MKSIDYSNADPAVADGIKLSLKLPGKGQKNADDITIKSILGFVSDLSARAGFLAKAGPDMPAAREALTDYFTALHSGDYILGGKLYGGPTDLLQTWNPDIKNDLPTLFKRACQQNGIVCMLLRSITYRGLDSRGGVQFLVEFNNPDGSLFVQGPCCGEPSGDQTGAKNVPGISNYLFSVLSASGDWKVMDLPPYVP